MDLMNKKEKIVGILGGMGPLATIDVFSKIVKATPAKKDWEHLRIIIDNNPKIPSRTRAVVLGEQSPLPAMIETAKNLENAGADLIIIPCNSAHYYIEDLKKSIHTPILNIIEITAKYLAENLPNVRRIGLLGGLVTINMKIYEKELQKYAISVVVPETKDQELVSNVIEGIKLGKTKDNLVEDIEKVSKNLIAQGAQCIVLACTELAILMDGKKTGVLFVDPNKVLAEETVKIAKNIQG